MTMKKGYIPRQDGKKKTWAMNLKAKLPAVGATLGLTPAEITNIGNACNDIDNQINLVVQGKTTLKNIVSTKQSKVNADETLIRTLVKRMKTNANYTVSIGNDLGIIGEDMVIDEDNSKPTLTLVKVPTGWRIEFNLMGYFDGVNIYKKKATDTDFSFLARDTSSPYIDTNAVDNGTHYIAYFVVGDDEVGQPSDDAVVQI